ncbi:MAG: histidine--tRNA ligase [bacterium]
MIQSVKGTKDLLPDKIGLWHFIEKIFSDVSSKYNYQELRTPIFEKTEVFSRSIGETTDIVNKEMYTFTDKSGESLTLKPEGTAALVRAVIQNSLLQSSASLRLWYFGPFFRHERPQKGRFRQFHQYGAECIGSDNPESDAEIIFLANDIIQSAGISDYRLLLNSLGTNDTRLKYKHALTDYLHDFKDKLSEDSRNRFENNPLRILDSKAPNDIELLNNAPVILDYLDSESSEHFEKVRELLNISDIKVEIQPQLVRGLDYYCQTVFEFQSSALGSQDSIGGGGRYDGLFEQFGFKQKVPAIGFAMGVERLLLILEESNKLLNINKIPDVYLILTEQSLSKKMLEIAQVIRNKECIVTYDLLQRSVKAQLREANKLNCKFTIILGENELNKGKVLVKNMDNGEEAEIDLSKIKDLNFS